MFAIIWTGGKQYKVKPADVIKVEKLDVSTDQPVILDQVLLLGDGATTHIGTPYVEGATVHAEVVDHIKAEKVIIFKKKRRHTYRRKKGHRQLQTILRIVDVCGKGQKPSAAASSAKPATKSDGKSKASPKAETASAPKAAVKAKVETKDKAPATKASKAAGDKSASTDAKSTPAKAAKAASEAQPDKKSAAKSSTKSQGKKPEPKSS